MWQRFTHLVSAFQIRGVVPRAFRGLVSTAGVIVVVAALAVFVKQSWFAEVSDDTIIYTGLVLLVGIILVRSATPPDDGGDR